MNTDNPAGFIELSASGVAPVRLEGGRAQQGSLVFLQEGIEGWYSTPDLKTGLVERGQGDGAHDVASDGVAYGSRTVEVQFAAWGRDRQESLRLFDKVRRFAHCLTRLRLVDADHDGYVEGMASFAGPPEWEDDWMRGTLYVTCARPEILSTEVHRGQMVSAVGDLMGVGLQYGPGVSTYWTGDPNGSASVFSESLAGIDGLRYPLRYMLHERTGRSNQATLVNNGTSRAYPVFTVYGAMPDGVDIVTEGTPLRLRCSQPVYGVPLVLDCRSRSATVGGLDVSRTLSSRGFPTVEPGSSSTFTLRSTGSGWVDVALHDTWM